MNPLFADEPLVLSDPYLGRMSDDEFFNFCQSNRKWRIERNAAHDILLMAPTYTLTGKRNARLLGQLYAWWEEHQEVGEIFDSNAGFTLPNGAVRSPDASWVSASRWQALTPVQQEKFAAVCPEFVVELRSKTDSLKVLLAKLEEYRQNGTRLGWLLSCDDEKTYIFRAGQEGYEMLEGFERELSGEDVLPGLRVDLRKLR
ncbi:Uma2 family endonuclease [Hymenobacter sp. BRD128]|uniref:Uma2 family endonuclease n=1 Tax=Hymenobacter sp. BRD128 TaxID=2675878 RepID=UPI0020B8C3BC|nr:Uma2 family endonuclease [Hymenobacter sp. BRD128]